MFVFIDTFHVCKLFKLLCELDVNSSKKFADFYFIFIIAQYVDVYEKNPMSFYTVWIYIYGKCVSVIRRWHHCSDIKAICQNAQKSVCVFVRWAKQFPAKRRKVLIRKTVFISLTSHIIDATLNLKCWHCNIIPLRYWDFFCFFFSLFH